MPNLFDDIPIKRIEIEGGGFVELVHTCPEIWDERGADSIIASAARTSFNNFKLEKTAEDDRRLIKRLFQDRHTSPFEMGNVTFLVKAPKYVTIQILRHRTGKFNEESQRYHQIKEGYFHPSSDPERFIRVQHSRNKQSSDQSPKEKLEPLIQKFQEIEAHLDKTFELYNEAIQLGAARECARFCLPAATWSHIVVQFDLNNLTKFLTLRLNNDAQYEIRLVARAMYQLAKQVFPVTFECFDEFQLTDTMKDAQGELKDGLIFPE